MSDNTYINCVINPSFNNAPAIFDQTFTLPLLDDPSQYYCSIIRFVAPLNAIPYFHFPLNINQSNANVGSLIFGIKTTLNVKTAVPVIYVPNNNLPVPTTTAVSAPYWTNNQAISDYYGIFSIQQVITMFNVAVQSALTASGTAGSAVYSYNSTTQLISLTVNAAFVATGASIFMNDAAENFLSTFQFYENYTPTVEDDYYHVLTPLPAPVGGPYVFVEEAIGMSLWYDLRNIIITSNSLPIRFESVPSGSDSGLVAYKPIVTDFIIGLDDVNVASCIAIYNPQSQYRLIDMTSHTSIVKIQLSILYADKFGNNFPLLLDRSQSASIKLGFFKKNLFQHYVK